MQAETKKPRRPLRFRKVVGTRPADEILAQIRDQLARHALKSGDRLPSERQLAEQFEVSRNSVRQALRSLVDGGLIEMKKGAAGGAFIRDGGGAAVSTGLSDLYSLGTIGPEHLTESRVLIAVEVARLATQRCTDADLDELEANIVLAEAAAREGKTARRTDINLEFYRLIAKMTRNPILVVITDAVNAITRKFVEEIGPTSNASVMPYRRKLLARMRERDADGAAEQVRDHLLRLQGLYLRASRKARSA